MKETMLRWGLFTLVMLAFIIVPFLLWEQPLTEWSHALLATSRGRGLLVVAVVVLLALDVVLPIPSSFVSAAAVALLGAWAGAGAIWLGLTVAAWVGYGLGRLGGVPLATRIAGKSELERAQSMMDRHGAWVLLACRGAPVLAEASTLFAGAVRQRASTFGIVTGLGNLGLAMAYSVIALLELEGALEVVVPFSFGLLVPGAVLLLARRLGFRRGGA